MNLKERLAAPETKIGKFLRRELTIAIAICTALGAANEYLVLLPPDWIPTWAKTVIPIAGLISFVAGRLTVKPEIKEEKAS